MYIFVRPFTHFLIKRLMRKVGLLVLRIACGSQIFDHTNNSEVNHYKLSYGTHAEVI